MPARTVPDFNSVVLRYLKAFKDGGVPVEKTQLSELPPELSKLLARQIQDVLDAKTMSRLTGKNIEPSQSKIDMSAVLEYFSSASVDAESLLLQNALDLPLPNYFVNTSHNTYLTGNQLYGSASTAAYKDVLRAGCRSIEIDVWDGKSNEDGPSGASPASMEPRVLHGHTLTKEVSFREVCNAIEEAAFETSDLPVIVSLEVHACAQQQQRMVQIMQEVWRNRLIPALEEECVVLPSPDQLRGKILVKVKGTALVKPQNALNALEKTPTADSTSASEQDSTSDEATKNTKPQAAKSKKKASKIVDSLSALGVYTRAYHFKNFSLPESALPTHVFSLSEGKVMAMHDTDGARLFRHNRNYMMRAFPSGSRVTSSNLDPPLFWRKGIQMVALNWQKVDASIMLNRAMFADSNGWMLKPAGYRSDSTAAQSNPTPLVQSDEQDVKRYRLDLSIEVMAAQSLPPAKSPYVKCELHVEMPSETKGQKSGKDGKSKDGEHKRRTKTSKDLDFHRETLEFSNVDGIVPELSFVR